VRPDHGAVSLVERIQDSGRTERIDTAVTQRRRPARAGTAIRFPEACRISMSPYRLTGAEPVTRHDFLVATLLLCVEEIAVDGEGRPPRPDRLAPQFDWRRLAPIGLDSYAVDDAVAVGTAETRPLGLRVDHGWSGRLGLIVRHRRSDGDRSSRLIHGPGRNRRRRRSVSSGVDRFVDGLRQKSFFWSWRPTPMKVGLSAAADATCPQEGEPSACQ